MIRLAHLSDVHITSPVLDWRARDWFNKRYAAWINFRYLGRRYRFRRADNVLRLLVADIRERSPDRVIFSGDATALGFEAEQKRAAEILGVGDGAVAGLAVPGNHDYVTKGVASSGLFERYFAPWMQGERVAGTVYPFAQRAGGYWLIGVNSCTGNRWPWDAGGKVGHEQLERLRLMLKDLPAGPRILVTHYPVLLASGARERPWHGLRDMPEMLRVAADGGVCLWLHGHRHSPYHLKEKTLVPFPVICAGSATQNGLWSYGEYTLDGPHCMVVRRMYDERAESFREAQKFELHMPC